MAAPGRRAAYKLRAAGGMWLPLNGNSATSPIWQLKDQLISAASKCASTKGRCVIWNVDQNDAAHPYLSTGQSDEGQTLSTNCSERGYPAMGRTMRQAPRIPWFRVEHRTSQDIGAKPRSRREGGGPSTLSHVHGRWEEPESATEPSCDGTNG